MNLKKILVSIFCIAMVLSAVGFSVFADNTSVAKIGNTEYSTFSEALEATKEMSGDVVIELLDDAELSYGAREAYGKDDTTSITINGNYKTLTLNQTDSDWSSIGMANADGVFKMNNVNVVKTGYGVPKGAWNTHAINFNVNTELTNVDFDNSIKVSGTSVLTNVDIVEDEEFYGIWIPADAESVTINGGSIIATNGGRGIKIADQYVGDTAQKVSLTVDGMTFETAKKAAVLVSSTAGADITAANCDITKVAADPTNFAWVDEDWSSSADKVTVNNESAYVEGTIVINNIDDLKAFRDDVNAGNTYEGKFVMLSDDIDLAGENWTPIGNDINYFMGTFDGGNHTISNMTIDIESEGNVFAGLFGGVKKATVKNLKMTDVSIDVVGAKVRAAAVVGIAHSNSENRTDATINFENITVDGCEITAEAKSVSALLGGVVGYCYPANMENISVFDLTINGKAEGNELRSAAICGYVCGQNISNNGNTRATMLVDTFKVSNVTINAEAYTVFSGGYAPYTYYGYITLENGTIDGIKMTVDAHEAFVGGLVGYFWRSDNGHTVNNVNITGVDFDVTTDYLGETRVGGVVGTSQSPNTKYNDVTVAGKIVERCSDPANPVNYHAKVGGFVARTYEYAQQTYTNCVADVDVTSTNVAGGFVGNHNSTVSYVNCEAKGDVTADIAGGFAGRLTEHGYTTAVTFDNCKASGNVAGTNVAGGLIGSTVNHGWAAWEAGKGTPYAKTVTLVDCETTGTVTSGTAYCAGVVGELKMAEGVDFILDNVDYSVEPACYPETAPVVIIVAQIGDQKFATLEAAIAAAQDGDTIDLMGRTVFLAGAQQMNIKNKDIKITNGTIDITGVNIAANAIWLVNSSTLTFENVSLVGDGYDSAFGVVYLVTTDAGVKFINSTVDLNADGKSGGFVKGDGYMGTVLIDNSDITLVATNRGFISTEVTIQNDSHVSISGNKSLANYGIENAFNICGITVTDTSTIDIKDCYEYGIKIGDAAVNIKDTAKVTATGSTIADVAHRTASNTGILTIEKDASLEAENIVLNNIVAGEGTIISKADTVYVQYRKTDVDANGDDTVEGKDIYEIVLAGANAEKINELASADLTFNFVGTPVNGGAMSYFVEAAEGVTLSQLGDRFMFNYDGITKYEESGAAIVIGTITVDGYGAYTLATADVDTNAVYATEIRNNIVDGFIPAAGLEINKDMVADDGMVGNITDGNVAVPTRELAINITFPNAVEGNEAAYQQMSVTIVGGTVNETIALGTDGEDYSFTRDLPYNTTYTVTVSGAGYRTARYSVTLTEDKTLNFWNNVMDNAIEVEDGNTASAETKNFLAGDIVKDNNINIYDLSAVVSYFGKTIDKTTDADYAKYDLNRDGKIDSKDVAYVLVSWGE